MKLYHNPSCSKSRKAKELVPKETEIVEYLKNPLSVEALRELCTLLDLKPTELIRQNEEEYKMLVKKHGLPDDETALVWISEYPKIMQRPIFVKDTAAIIARPPERIPEFI